MEVQLPQTREAWLNYVAQRMAPIFETLRAPLPAQLRIAIGFTSSGRRSRNIGECWDNQCSEDRHFEIFIRPDLSQSKDLMPMQVAAVLGHELVHAAVGVAAGHGKEFRRVARGHRPDRANGGDYGRARIRAGDAADTGSSRAAAPRQTSASGWRQQPFQQTQKAVLSSGQMRLQQLRLHGSYHAQMVRLGRGTAMSKARSNGRREDVTSSIREEINEWQSQ
jgi:hypothetical protein